MQDFLTLGDIPIFYMLLFVIKSQEKPKPTNVMTLLTNTDALGNSVFVKLPKILHLQQEQTCLSWDVRNY